MRASDKAFKDYHLNFQAVLMLFINGSSFIHLDSHWIYYLLYKSIKHNGANVYALQGYATTYEFWEDKPRCSTRISQFLILPTYQKQGLGKDLLKVVF